MKSSKRLKLLSFLTLFSLIAILISACGGNSSNEVTIKPKSTNVKGDLKDYFKVVNKDYKIKIDEESFLKEGMITVEIERTDKPFDFPTNNIEPFGTIGSEDYHVGFGIEGFDKSGNPIIIKNATNGGILGPYSSDDVTGLMNLGKGEKGFIRWSLDGDKVKNLASFQITSALKKVTHNSVSSSSLSPSSSVSNSTTVAPKSSNDWDKMLDDYEEYVDKYIKFFKKAQKGDMSAMQEYPSLMEKATELQKSMQKAQNNNELSAEQIRRMTKIQTKLLQAASSN